MKRFPKVEVLRGRFCVQLLGYLEPFRLSLEKLQEVSNRLRRDMIRGLNRHSHHNAPVKMLPTFVQATPDGTGERSRVAGPPGPRAALLCFLLLPVVILGSLLPLLLAEKGDFLALDLGGTNFRVLHVRVVEEEQKVLKMDSQICAIPTEIMLGPGEEVRQL